MRRALAAAAVLACLTAATSCSNSEAGTPTAKSPAPTSESSTTSQTEENWASDAPKVSNPLDTKRFQQAPCSALTAAQTQALGVGPTGEVDDNDVGNGCQWKTADRGLIDINWVNGKNGLRGAYADEELGKIAHFEVVPDIEGYPAVIANYEDQRKRGECTVELGTDDTTSLIVFVKQSAGNQGTNEPCAVSTRVAKEIVTTIKAG